MEGENSIYYTVSLRQEFHAAILWTMCLAIVYLQLFKAYMCMVYHKSLHYYEQMYKPFFTCYALTAGLSSLTVAQCPTITAFLLSTKYLQC